MGNQYVAKLRSERDDALKIARGLADKATQENRELSDDEKTQAATIMERANSLKAQIDQFAWMDEDQERTAAAGKVAAAINDQVEGHQRAAGDDQVRDGGSVIDGRGEHVRTLKDGETTLYRSVNGWYALDRDPGHYRSVKEGGHFSFFGDLFAANVHGDQAARDRLTQHNRGSKPAIFERAVVSGTGGAGLIAPHWLVQEYAEINRQARLLANRVRNIPLAGDYRPLTLPKQTAGTDSNVAVQTTEGANNAGWGTDAYTSNVDTVTPKPYAAYQDVSRQLLTGSTPGVDQLIFADMRSVLDFKIETLVANTMLAAAVAGDTIPTDSTGGATSFVGAGVATGAVIDGMMTAWGNRFLPPDIITCAIPRYGKFRKLVDSAGRPLMPVTQYQLMNAVGEATGVVSGTFEGLDVLPTAGMGAGASYPEKFIVARSQDTVLFTDDVLQFEFDQVVGPSAVRLGIWSYAAAITRYSGTGTVAVTVTAA